MRDWLTTNAVPLIALLLAISFGIFYFWVYDYNLQTPRYIILRPEQVTATTSLGPAIPTTSSQVKSSDALNPAENDELAKLADISLTDVMKTPDGRLIYESEGNVYEFDTISGITRELVSASQIQEATSTPPTSVSKPSVILPGDFSIVDDQNDLYFKLQYGEFSSYVGSVLYIYHFHEDAITHTIDVWEDWVDDRSPDGRYLSTFFSTCACGGSMHIFDLSRGGEAVYSGLGGYVSPLWTHVAYKRPEADFYFPIEGAAAYSLFIKSIHSTSSAPEKLLVGTATRSYVPRGWLSNNELIYEELIFSMPMSTSSELYKDEENYNKMHDAYTNPSQSVWKIDTLTKQTTKLADTVEREDTTEMRRNESYSNKLKARQWLSPQRKWKVVLIGEWPKREIYLVDAEDTFKYKVADGNSVLWMESP
jgi:hypothetical protein